MSVSSIPRPARARVLATALPPIAIMLGCLALAAREPSWRSMLTLALVGAIGLLGPIAVREQRAAAPRVAWVTALGVASFVAARTIDAPIAPPFVLAGAAANVFAAFAEEAFFRRFVYGWLARRGALLAVMGSAVLFALVHVPQYGAAVLPIDLAAGALLGWQRWASGSWVAPAITHAIANLLQMG